jgi:hypothetical protein
MAVASIRDVPPNVFSLFLGGAPPPGEDDRLQFWAAADVTVSGQPVTGLLLAMQPGMIVSGQVVFQGATLAPPENLRRARLSLAPALAASEAGVSSVRAELDEDGRFQFLGVVPGEYRLQASGMSGWWPKSAMVAGQDVLDGTLTVTGRESVTGLTLTMADRHASVSGLLQNQLAQPIADYTVILAPADTRYWVPRSRRIRATRPGTDGLFTFGSLPAGDYRLAAVVDVEPGRWYDPAFLEQLLPASIAVRLGEGEQRVQNIRVAGQ